MPLTFCLKASLDGKELDGRLVQLLDALSTHGSVGAAARVVGVSYRCAWDRLRSAETRYGQPLVRMERGRGAYLTQFAVRLFEAQSRARKETAHALARIAREFDAEVLACEPRPASKLKFAASHDLALIELKEFCLHTEPRVDFDLQFRGSLDALSDLSRGRCDIAGFHVGPDADAATELRHLLSPRAFKLVVLGQRVQGLMLAAGNPKRIRNVADLAKRGVRFVNRQSGSGTRLLFDRLLAASGRKPHEILGYGTEEFTHVAVAATVASGHADAGFGIQAAAVRYGLSFHPLSQETYYLAVRRSHIDRPAARRLLEHMRSQELRRRLSRLRGYRVDECGSVVDVDRAFDRRSA